MLTQFPDLSLTRPWALLGLLAVPALWWARRRLVERRLARRTALARQGLEVPEAPTDRWRRVGSALVVAGLLLLVVGLTGPVAEIPEPRREGTVVLAFDVSTSMSATDLRPTRLEAAKAAARAFVERQPASVRIGVVAFGGSGVVTARPTDDRQTVLAAIARLRPQGDTSLGQGILGALGAIAGKPITVVADAETGAGDETSIGHYGGTAVVLLTDGEDTGGVPPEDAAQLASAAGVRIDPVGLGTPEGTVIEVEGFSIATTLDEAALVAIAETTGGTYRSADDAATLAQVYDSVEIGWALKTTAHEVTNLVAGLAALLLAAGACIAVLRQEQVV